MKQRANGKASAGTLARWWDWCRCWEGECPAGFATEFRLAELTFGLPRKLRATRAGQTARQIVLEWLELSEKEKFTLFNVAFGDRRWFRVKGEHPAMFLAGCLLSRMNTGDTDVLRAVADYIDALKYDKLLELTERLLEYALENRGRPVHTPREIKDQFAPDLDMRSTEWLEFLEARAIPHLPGVRGRPRKNGAAKK